MRQKEQRLQLAYRVSDNNIEKLQQRLFLLKSKIVTIIQSRKKRIVDSSDLFVIGRFSFVGHYS